MIKWEQAMVTEIRALLFLFVIVVCTSCGEKGRSDSLSFSASPESPIVINADIDDGDDTCAAPWYFVQYTMTNTSDRGAIVVAIKIQVDATVSGSSTTSTVDLVAEDGEYDDPFLMVVDKNETQTIEALICGLPKAEDLNFGNVAEAVGWFGGTDSSASDYTSTAVERLNKVTTYTAQ